MRARQARPDRPAQRHRPSWCGPRAPRTGPATLRVEHHGDRFEVEAWGTGADWALDAAPGAPRLPRRSGRASCPHHPVVEPTSTAGRRPPPPPHPAGGRGAHPGGPRARRSPASRPSAPTASSWSAAASRRPAPAGSPCCPRLGRDRRARATTTSTWSAWRRSGPTRSSGVPPTPAASRRPGELPSAELRARLEAIPGIGVWTSAEVARLALGDADAVSVGDFHLKNVVAWTLAQEPRGTDAHMLELLAPYAGHRGRVCLLIESAGISAPRYGPRKPHRADRQALSPTGRSVVLEGDGVGGDVHRRLEGLPLDVPGLAAQRAPELACDTRGRARRSGSSAPSHVGSRRPARAGEVAMRPRIARATRVRCARRQCRFDRSWRRPPRPAGRPDSAGRSPRGGPAALTLTAFVVSLLVQHTFFPGLSWNRDEPVYLWHVDVLRAGQLTATDGGHPSLFQPWLSAPRARACSSRSTPSAGRSCCWPFAVLRQHRQRRRSSAPRSRSLGT